MVAELVAIDWTQPCPENKLEFDLPRPFTNDHQLKLIFVDKMKRHAYFCTESATNSMNMDEPFFMDYVHFIKIAVDTAGKLNVEQDCLPLPEEQVATKVICTVSNEEEAIHCFCFYQKQLEKHSCQSFKVLTNNF